MRNALLVLLLLSCGWAVADDGVVKLYSLSVQEHLDNLEPINMAAAKPAVADRAALDDELADILRELRQIEAAERGI